MIRVFIADDFGPMRKIMRRIVEDAPDMAWVGEAIEFREALAKLSSDEVEPDVILVNDYLPPLSSPEAIRRMRESGIKAPVLVISMHDDIEVAREALAAGGNGYILKTEFPADFLTGIRAVHKGETFHSRRLSELLGGS